MPLLIDRAMMESVFPGEVLVTLEAEIPPSVTDPGARAVLCEVGLPDEQEKWFSLHEGFAAGMVPLSEHRSDLAGYYGNFPDGASEWLNLGMIPYDEVALDGSTGTLYCLPDGEREIYRMNSSLETFCYFLYALERERPKYDAEMEADAMDPEGAASSLLEELSAVDPVAFARPDSVWHHVLEGVRYALDLS